MKGSQVAGGFPKERGGSMREVQGRPCLRWRSAGPTARPRAIEGGPALQDSSRDSANQWLKG